MILFLAYMAFIVPVTVAVLALLYLLVVVACDSPIQILCVVLGILLLASAAWGASYIQWHNKQLPISVPLESPSTK